MKTKTFILTAKFEIDLQSESADTIKRQITSAMNRAIGDGLITGSTAATVEDYQFDVKEKTKRKAKKFTRKSGEHCFSHPLNGIPRCIDCGCDEDDAYVGGEKCCYKAKK